MPLELILRDLSSVPIEVEGLVPDALAGKSLAEIERWPIFRGNEQLPLAELFRVHGAIGDGRIVFQGDMQGVHRIGAHMKSGQVHVAGSAGRHVASEMTGGEITVDRDVADWAGAEMDGGILRVHGNAGHQLGAAYRGSQRGMTGGVILVHGKAGDEVGHTMRRGLIAVGGSVGDFTAINMIAGSVIVCGHCGLRPAAGMQRGTLALFGERPSLLPTFRAGGQCEPLFLRLYLREIARLGLTISSTWLTAKYDLFHGDLLNGGRGEILWPSGP